MSLVIKYPWILVCWVGLARCHSAYIPYNMNCSQFCNLQTANAVT